MRTCETTLDLAMIAADVDWAIAEALRLYPKYLLDDYTLTVYDNSVQMQARITLPRLCRNAGIRYVQVPARRRWDGRQAHADALQHACEDLLNRQAPVIGFLDHDVYPVRPTSVLALVEARGFYGVGQRNTLSGETYLWPGFCFFSREWLAGRRPNFSGRPGGDTGAALAELISEKDLATLPKTPYRYRQIREPDGHTQSWAVEEIGDFIHLGNTSNWLRVPRRQEREALVRELVAAL